MTFGPRNLVDLDPRWIADNQGRVHGIAFRCPIHDKVPGSDEFDCMHSIGFTNPIDGGPPQRYWTITWARRGDTFETLVLSPSIRCHGYQGGGGCSWHGFVGGSKGQCPGVVTTEADSS